MESVGIYSFLNFYPGELMEMANIKLPWTKQNKVLLSELHSNDESGLSIAEAVRRLEISGPNKIESVRKVSTLLILIKQFISPFALLLIIAAGLSFFFGEWLDATAILVVILLNAVIGFLMEYGAEHSMEALKNLTTVPARVIRDGVLTEISSEEVVPGDILYVEEGDMITADARILKNSQLQTDESALTGESLPVEKRRETLPEKIPLAERNNMLYKGTFVNKGNGYGVVVNTGMSTELGAIARMVQEARQSATPLEKKIQVFSRKLIWITVALVVIIFISGLLNGHKMVSMLQTSIALAVAAIPEGLPIVATLALAFGMLRMARHRVLVKRLSSVETLGGTNVICTDKTGTLTQNRIEASFVQIEGKASRIQVDLDSTTIHWLDDKDILGTTVCAHLFRIAALCNTASYHGKGKTARESGDPLEVSLLKMVYCTDTKPEDYRHQYPKIGEVPFSSDTKIMATLHRHEQEHYVAAKGAVEELLAQCTLVLEKGQMVSFTEEKKRKWLDLAEKHAGSGLRMLAFAFRNIKEKEENFLHHLVLTGLIGFIDPPRVEVPAAIKECRSAGIKVVMITGDHPATAKNIALRLGLAKEGDEVMHGNRMKPYGELTQADKERWLRCSIFARVTPRNKLDLVTLYQERKMVVGMTGDGVNDAPALKKADIGIAMGLRGTQVAQEVADMVLKDDAFSSIVMAIRQGRVIFDNIRKFVIFLLSCNLSELLIIATAAILNLHFQLLPLQILFINLVTDVLPALALGVTEAATHIMQRKPYPSQVAIIDRKRWSAIFSYSLVMSITTIAAVFVSHEFLHGKETDNRELCNNVLFYTLICSQILHVFNMSFEKDISFFKSEVFRNKYVWLATITCIGLTFLPYGIIPLRRVLDVSIHGWRDWSIIIGAAFSSLFFIQLIKKLRWVI